jgi:hypothetical protein
MAKVKKLYVPKTVAELVYGNTSCDEPNPAWHILDFGGGGEHTFCTLAIEEIEDLSLPFGIKTKSKRGGYCDCPDCIRRIVTLKNALKKIKEVEK